MNEWVVIGRAQQVAMIRELWPPGLERLRLLFNAGLRGADLREALRA